MQKLRNEIETMMSIAQIGRRIRARKKYKDFLEGKLSKVDHAKRAVETRPKIREVVLIGNKRCKFGNHNPFKTEFSPHARTEDGLRDNCKNCERYKKEMFNLDFINKFKSLQV